MDGNYEGVDIDYEIHWELFTAESDSSEGIYIGEQLLKVSYLAPVDIGISMLDDDKLCKLILDRTLSWDEYLEELNNRVSSGISADDMSGVTGYSRDAGYDPTIGRTISTITGMQLSELLEDQNHCLDFESLRFLSYYTDAKDIGSLLYPPKDEDKTPYHEPSTFKVGVLVPREFTFDLPDTKELERIHRFQQAVYGTNPSILGVYSSPALMKMRPSNPSQQAWLKRKEQDRIG